MSKVKSLFRSHPHPTNARGMVAEEINWPRREKGHGGRKVVSVSVVSVIFKRGSTSVFVLFSLLYYYITI